MSGKRVARSVTGSMDPSRRSLGRLGASQPAIQQHIHGLEVLTPAGRGVGAQALKLLRATRAITLNVIDNCTVPTELIKRIAFRVLRRDPKRDAPWWSFRLRRPGRRAARCSGGFREPNKHAAPGSAQQNPRRG